MPYEVILAPEAAADLKRLDAHYRTAVKSAMEQYLRHQPTRTSKSRIKRLRGILCPQYRLRVGDIRVFYDVTNTNVQVLAVVPKSRAQEWLEKWGG
jgi:mRNA-degrading endonuclease RelE of RelBE toxin-antitoxin system